MSYAEDVRRLNEAFRAMRESAEEEEQSGFRPMMRGLIAEHMAYIQEVRPTKDEREERSLEDATWQMYRWHHDKLGKDGLLAWHQKQMERFEAQRQRRLLRQGHRTLTAIRKSLRTGQAPSLPPESRQARSSPTS